MKMKNTVSKPYLITFILLVVFALVVMPPAEARASSKTAISKKTLTLYTGQTYKLKVLNTNSEGKWNSSNSKIAAVNKNTGKVTAKKKGTCKIRVKVGKKTYKCKLTVKKTVDIFDNYYADSNVARVARAIGGMKISKNSTYKNYCYKKGIKIGILADRKSSNNHSQIDVYNQLTDVINTGYKGVTFHGARIGDSYAVVKRKLEKNYTFKKSSSDPYVFWNGDASCLKLKFKNGKLVSYVWKLRYTS